MKDYVRPVRKREPSVVHDKVNSRDIQLHYLMNKYQKNPTIENFYLLKEEEDSRMYFDNIFNNMATEFGADEE